MVKFTDELAKKLVEKEGYEYFGSEMRDNKRYIRITCNNGHSYSTRWDQFKTGCRCRECKKLTYDDVKYNIEKEGYVLLSKEYVNYHSNLDMMCPKGHHISMQYANFMQGRRCKFCANNVRHDIEFVRKLVESISGYHLLSDTYENWETKLNIECNNGHIFSASYNSFEQGHRCPHCARSVGEEKVAKVLDNNNVNYESQYKFDDCIKVRPLPFDFYIQDKNIAIEYQGVQHYRPIDLFGGEESFIEQQKRDEIKLKYCIDNGIKLICIPYWDLNNIEQILKNEKVI